MDDIDVQNLKGITQDSRKVEEGYLFAAIPGTNVDGRDFIPDAIAAGASHILAPAGTELPSNDNVTFIADDNPRKKLSELAAAFYKDQPEFIAAVTGTNGKTSTVTFAEQFWSMEGKNAKAISTITGSLTTPDPVELHKDLADFAHQGMTHLAFEASSHGLDQYRLHGVRLKTAGFTNLSQDHLDYHKDMEDYFQAKLKLFTEVLDKDGTAVLNADVPEYEKIKPHCKNVISYGFAGEDLHILNLTPKAQGQDVQLRIFGEELDLHFPLVGQFQIMNALCALGFVLAGNRESKAYQNLDKLKGVRGRLEPVPGHLNNAGVYVDYAHTPDALVNVLKAVRPHTSNRVICIAGCGGDRDKTKRPLMALAASDNADHVIVSDDNPRSEEPAAIRADMIAGLKDQNKDNYEEIDGRGNAIKSAIEMLEEGDVLVIAGKGHEQGIEFADRIEPFDDVEESQKAIEEMK